MRYLRLGMVLRLLVICSLGIAGGICHAVTVDRANFSGVIEAVRLNPSRGDTALEFLQAAAEGRSDAASALALSFGFSETEIGSVTYTSREGRAAAFRAIGLLGTPEALAYLDGLSAADFELAETSDLWSAARIALYQSQLDAIPSWPAKAIFLEDLVVSEQLDSFVRSRVMTWASEQLCENGILTSLSVVQGMLYKWAGSRAQEQAQFCEDRMRAVAANPDRIAALADLLQVSQRPPNYKLIRWAVYSLSSIDDPRALDALTDYERAVLELPAVSPLRASLMDLANEIRWLNRKRIGPPPVDDPTRGHIIE